MIVLDTNVVSEGLRPRPNMLVKAWTDAQHHSTLYLCTPVIAELRFGLERLQNGRRKTDLRHGIDRIESDLFERLAIGYLVEECCAEGSCAPVLLPKAA